mmetsp:Transcript_108279/g.191806  ORF Transcript_108279/g.191806 Transcript_108279/m.191806 type:complete len:210 (-) Transcript_108279:36-665(-)
MAQSLVQELGSTTAELLHALHAGYQPLIEDGSDHNNKIQDIPQQVIATKEITAVQPYPGKKLKSVDNQHDVLHIYPACPRIVKLCAYCERVQADDTHDEIMESLFLNPMQVCHDKKLCSLQDTDHPEKTQQSHSSEKNTYHIAMPCIGWGNSRIYQNRHHPLIKDTREYYQEVKPIPPDHRDFPKQKPSLMIDAFESKLQDVPHQKALI